MTPPLGPCVWVFHTGALGDHVLIWPFVRALARQGTAVTVVAASSHARLCEAEVGRQATGASGPIRGLSIEQPRFTRMWTGEGPRPEWIVPGVDVVVTHVSDESSEEGRRWFSAASAMFPGAAVVHAGAPESIGRSMLWGRAGAREWGSASPAGEPVGPATLFVGAGGAAKRWPPDRWSMLARGIREGSPGLDVQVLAGPVEAERWPSAVRAEFERVGGRVIGGDGDLRPLADAIRASQLYIGCDTGPTHLAAQLGVPTLALFGPTDPRVWSPVGPRVRVLAPAAACAMDWLNVEAVMAEIETMRSQAARVT